MKRCLTAGAFAAGLLLAAAPSFAQSKAKAQNVPEIPFESVPNFLKFPPNIYLGEGIGVATNSKGHVFVYTRSGDTRLFEFGADPWPLKLVSSSTASGRRPITIVTRPAGLNLITMFVPSSTAQMLSCASTRTECANEKP